MDGLDTAAPTAAPEATTVPTETVAPVAAPPPSDAAATQTTPAPPTETAPETTAASEPEDIQDFIKKGLNDIFGTPAAESNSEKKVESPQTNQNDAPEVVEGAAEENVENVDSENAAPQEFKLLSADEINTEFLRAPKGIREYAIQASEKAKFGDELLQRLGGEYFVEPMAEIADGIQKGENFTVFQGLLKSGGVDSFAEFIDDAVTLAFVTSQQGEPQTDGDRFLREKCQGIADTVLKARFGENADIARIEELLKYDREGYLNIEDVREYFQKNAGEGEDNPLVQSLKTEVESLKNQLSDKKTSDEEAKTNAERQVQSKFTELTDSSLNQSLEKLVYSDSVLKPLETDTPELQAAKSTVKTLIDNFVMQSLKGHQGYKPLQSSFSKGAQGTALFQKNLADIIGHSVLEAKDLASKLEPLISAIYKNSRNAALLEKTTPADETETGEPTITQPPKDKKSMTTEEYHEYLARELATI